MTNLAINPIYPMKTIFLIVLLTLSTLRLPGQNNLSVIKTNENSFPTNIYHGSIGELEKFEDKIIAYDRIIEKIEISKNNTPFYKLKIGDQNHLWTVLMFKNDTNKIGDKIRVVGYLVTVDPSETKEQYVDTKYTVIAFGLIDFNNSNFLFLNGAEKQKQEWVNGEIPSSG